MPSPASPADPRSLTPATQRQLETLDRLAQRFGTSLQSAFSRNVGEGRRLEGALDGIGRALAGATARAAMRPLGASLADALRGAFSAPKADEAGTDAVGFAKGGVVSGGVVWGGLLRGGPLSPRVTPFARGGVVAAPTYFPLTRGLGLMGEAGAEAIMPLARGPDGRLGVRAGQGARPVQVTVNIATPDAEGFRRSEAQVAAALARAVARGQRSS